MPDADEYIRTLRDETAAYPERIDALEALVETGDERLTDILIEILGSSERFVRRKAVEILAEINEPRVRDALCSAAMTDSDEGVRRNAVRALANFADDNTVKALYHAMNDGSAIVKKEAEESLKKVRKKRLEVGAGPVPLEETQPAAAEAPPEERAAPEAAEEKPTAPPQPSPPAPTAVAEEKPPSPPRPRPERPAEKRIPEKMPPVPVHTEPRGYVPPELARLPALRGLSASEELGWHDLLRCLKLARSRWHLTISALALLLFIAGLLAVDVLWGLPSRIQDIKSIRQFLVPVCLAVIWAWVVFSWAGIIISRMTALRLANKPSNPDAALRFCARRLLSFIPPIIVCSFLWLIPVGIIFLVGKLSLIPLWGKAIGVLCYPICLLLAFMSVLVLIGTVAGLPMMTATICVENTGCSDAVTSAWAFVFSKPWRYLFYWAVAFVHCAVNLFIAFGTVYVTHGILALARGSANPFEPLQHFIPDTTPFGMVKFLLLFLFVSYAVSYYFTARTGIYMLMRKAVDGVELTEIAEV